MDFNLVIMAGTLAAPPELGASSPVSGRFDAGDFEEPAAQSGRLLMTVRSGDPRRVDLLAVAAHVDRIPPGVAPGDRIWVAGSLQRRFSTATGRSRIEVVAHDIQVQPSRRS